MVLIVLLQSTSSSQAIQCYGVKAGACAATQTGWFGSEGYRWGFDVGGYVEWLISNEVIVSTETHYVQKGIRFIKTVDSDEGPWYFEGWSPRADYVSFPVVVKARLMDAEFSPYLLAGPRIDFLIHTDEDGIKNSHFNDLEKMDYGITIGAGVELNAEAAPHLGIEIRCSPSLKAVFGPYSYRRNNSTEILLVFGI